MRLLIFSPYYPPHIGGVESHADEFNKHLSQRGAQITVFTPRLPNDAPEEEIIHNGVRVIRFPAFEIVYNYPLPKFWSYRFWKLFLKLYRQSFDVVISRTRFFNTSLWALLYAKTTRTKWMHIEHGSDYSKLDSHWKSKIAQLYDHTCGKIVLYWSDINVANSQASANFVRMLCPKKECAVIYRGVDWEKIISVKADTVLKEQYADKIIVVYLGRLIDGKGVQDLLTAISQIDNSNIVAFIIGDGGYRKPLENLVARLHLSDSVVFWGHKSFVEALAILKTADIVVNPSYTEGLPTTVIEAALCQKAIIATSVGGTPEIISDKESGLLFQSRDVKSLKKKIEFLLINEPRRNQFSRRAFQAVQDKFSWERATEQYWTILSQLKK